MGFIESLITKIRNAASDGECTFYPDGNWGFWCRIHDVECQIASGLQSKEERYKADCNLRDGVIRSGHPVHAWIIFLGVRTWANFKWTILRRV